MPHSDSPELALALLLSKTATSARRPSRQTAFPMLRGVRIGANGTTDLGLTQLDTGKPGVPAWDTCASGAATCGSLPRAGERPHGSCGGMLGFHRSTMWEEVLDVTARSRWRSS